MHTEFDARRFRAVGGQLRMHGRALGMPPALQEQVVVREPPRQRAWEKVDVPNLLVIGAYCMGFELEAAGSGAVPTLRIDYQLPSGGVARWRDSCWGVPRRAGACERWSVMRNARYHLETSGSAAALDIAIVGSSIVQLP